MIDYSKVSACLNTKEAVYPKEVLDHISKFPWGEILILTHSDSPYRKHELFAKAKYETIYYQDDDAICPIEAIMEYSKPDLINVAMKDGHYIAHANNRATMGLGWGSLFPKKLLESLKRYTDVYGEDAVFKRETERIFTYLNYPQNRMALPIFDLPSAYDESRLWRQPDHNNYKAVAEERCSRLV